MAETTTTSAAQPPQQQAASTTTAGEWEGFTFLLETEALFVGRDAVVGLLASGMKKRVSVVSPESLLAMLSDPAHAELSAELHTQHKSLAAAVASAATVPVASQTAANETQTQTSSVAGDTAAASAAAQQQGTTESLSAWRQNLARQVDGDVWIALLLARFEADKAAAASAAALASSSSAGANEDPQTDAPKAVGSVASSRKKKPAGEGSLTGGALSVAAAATAAVEEGRRSSAIPQKRGQAGSKGKKAKAKSASDFIDDAPPGCPDVLYLLDGFPASIDHVEQLAEHGVRLGAVVSLAMAPAFHRGSGDAGSLPSRQQRGAVARQQQQQQQQVGSAKGRKRRPDEKIGDADAHQGSTRAPETPATFSQLHSELKTTECCEDTIWVDSNDGDPTDPYETVHRLTTRLYEIFSLRSQYTAWLKTCPIIQTTGVVENERLLESRYEAVASGVPEEAFTPEVLVSHVVSGVEGATLASAETTEDALDADTEERLSAYIDDTLRWLLSENPSAAEAAASGGLGDLSEVPSLVVLRYGDADALRLQGRSDQVRQAVGNAAAACEFLPPIPGVGRHMMPATPEKSALEQANDLAELTKLLEGVATPQLTAPEVERTLTLLEFENMLAARAEDGAVPKFDDRVFVEALDSDVFPQVLANALETRPVMSEHYFADRDAMLICLDIGATSRFPEAQKAWKSQVPTKTTFKQWLETHKPAERSSASRPSTSTTTTTTSSSQKQQPQQQQPTASAAVYDIEPGMVRIEKAQHTLYLEDGCTLVAESTTLHSRTTGTVRMTVPGPFPAKVAAHTTKATKWQPPTASLTATFDDSTVLWAGKHRGTFALSYAQPDGRMLQASLDQWIEQTAPGNARKTDESDDIREDPLVVFEHNSECTDRETSRRVFTRGEITGVCRFFASGSTAVLLSTGETETFSSATGEVRFVSSDGKLSVKKKGEKAETIREYGAAVVSDPESGHVVVTREDMAMIVRSPTGETQARFPDGTTIRTAADGAAFVEMPGFVVVHRVGSKLSVALAEDVAISVSATEGIAFTKADTLQVSLRDGGEASFHAMAHLGVTTDTVRGGEYRFSLRTGTLLTPEYDNQRFEIEPGMPPKKHGASMGEGVSLELSHPPRLFRVSEDGSAVEYHSRRQLEPFFSALRTRKAGSIAELPVPGEEVIASVACIRQVLPMEKLTDHTAMSLSDEVMPRVIAFDDPDFVHRRVTARQQTQIVAVVRQLLRHRQLTDAQLDAFVDTLEQFEEQRRRETPMSLAPNSRADPRSPEEREAQLALQEKLCAMLRDEAEAARIAKECAETPKTQQQQQKQVQATPQAAEAPESMPAHPKPASRDQRRKPTTSSSQQDRLSYFESEEGASFKPRQQQSPTAPSRAVPAVVQQAMKEQKCAKPGTPPAVGLTIAEDEDARHEFTLLPSAKPAVAAAASNGHLAPSRRVAASRVPPPAQAFAVFPQALSFGTIEQGFAHRLELALTNMTFDSARFVVKKLSEVSKLRLAYQRGPVAPGMTVKISVELAARATGKYVDEISIVVGADGTVVRVVVTAEVLSHEDFAKLPAGQNLRRWRSKKVPLPGQESSSATAPSKPPTQFPPLQRK